MLRVFIKIALFVFTLNVHGSVISLEIKDDANLVELKSINYFLDELGDKKSYARKACIEKISRTCGYSENYKGTNSRNDLDWLIPFRCLCYFSAPVCYANRVFCGNLEHKFPTFSQIDSCRVGCFYLSLIFPLGCLVDLINLPSQACGYCLHKTCVKSSDFPNLQYRNLNNFQIYFDLLVKGEYEKFGLPELSDEKLSFIAEILILNNFEINYEGRVIKVVNGFFEYPVLKSMNIGEEAFKDELVQQIRGIRLKTTNFSLEHIARFTSFVKNGKGALLSKPPSSGFVLLEWFIENIDYEKADLPDT